MRRLGYLFLAALITSCALVRGLLPEGPPKELSASAIRLRAAETMAAGIALQDLIQTVRAETAELGGLAPDGGIAEPVDGGSTSSDGGWLAIDAYMARCYTTPSTYAVWVELDKARHLWKVVLLPEAQCAMDTYGGGGLYEIDAESFRILKRERFE